jgi:DnaJ family protein C protein 13
VTWDTLAQHPSVAIVKGAGLVMKALIEEGQGTIGREMQEMALKEGALIRHLLNALFLQTNDPRLLTLRQLSRHLVSLWTCQNPIAMELLSRILVSSKVFNCLKQFLSYT